MIPPAFTAFFAASAGAAAALVGLLFIAVSIAPQRVAGPNAPTAHRLVAAAVLGQLSDAFFVSLIALIPSLDVAGSVLALALLYFASFFPTSVIVTFRQRGALSRLRHATIPLAALVLYGWQAIVALNLRADPTDVGQVYELTFLLLSLFGVSLVRSWELLGATRVGLLSRLSPLADADEETARHR